MGKKKLEATRQLQRVAALPYNHYFEEELQKIRNKYGISEISRGYCFEDPSLKDLKDLDCREHHTLLVENGTIEVILPARSTGVKGHLISDIDQLLSKFGLPSAVFFTIFYYLFTGEPQEIFTWMAHDLGAKVSFGHEVIDPGERARDEIDEYQETVTVTVELSRWCSKELWEQIWDHHLEKELLKLRGGEHRARKVTLTSGMQKQMKRYSEWYQLSEIQRLGPVKALSRWEENHPSEYGKFDQSTITHAIKEFREIITPILTED